jgi:hypothetical protein
MGLMAFSPMPENVWLKSTPIRLSVTPGAG